MVNKPREEITIDKGVMKELVRSTLTRFDEAIAR